MAVRYQKRVSSEFESELNKKIKKLQSEYADVFDKVTNPRYMRTLTPEEQKKLHDKLEELNRHFNIHGSVLRLIKTGHLDRLVERLEELQSKYAEQYDKVVGPQAAYLSKEELSAEQDKLARISKALEEHQGVYRDFKAGKYDTLLSHFIKLNLFQIAQVNKNLLKGVELTKETIKSLNTRVEDSLKKVQEPKQVKEKDLKNIRKQISEFLSELEKYKTRDVYAIVPVYLEQANTFSKRLEQLKRIADDLKTIYPKHSELANEIDKYLNETTRAVNYFSKFTEDLKEIQDKTLQLYHSLGEEIKQRREEKETAPEKRPSSAPEGPKTPEKKFELPKIPEINFEDLDKTLKEAKETLGKAEQFLAQYKLQLDQIGKKKPVLPPAPSKEEEKKPEGPKTVEEKRKEFEETVRSAESVIADWEKLEEEMKRSVSIEDQKVKELAQEVEGLIKNNLNEALEKYRSASQEDRAMLKRELARITAEVLVKNRRLIEKAAPFKERLEEYPNWLERGLNILESLKGCFDQEDIERIKSKEEEFIKKFKRK
ncbi:MAG: hypothetical protein QW735_02815 [archaeon]